MHYFVEFLVESLFNLENNVLNHDNLVSLAVAAKQFQSVVEK